ncbi:hypothetical protein Emed_002877 [Eimeria media]
MAKSKWRKGSRQVSLRKKNRTTVLPYSIQKEIEASQDSTEDYRQAASSSDSDDSTSPSPRQQQISRKERRKKRRMQQRQQKHEHQLMRKKQRMGLINNHLPEQNMKVPLSTDESEGSSSVASDAEWPADDGSIGVAAAALKKQQQQQQSIDAQHEEFRLLERRLCKHKAPTKDTEEAKARRVQKLRQELNDDGFDFELQNLLDDIVGTGDQPPEACGVGKEETDESDAGVPSGTARQELQRMQARGSKGAAYRSKAHGESVDVAANMLKQQQQQHSGTDRLQDEMRMLEKRLLSHRGKKGGTEASAADKRKKLREELEKDGFDAELQNILDDILGTGDDGVDSDKSDAEESDYSGRGGDSSDLESGLHASDDETTRIEHMSALKDSEAQDKAESKSQSKTYVAPHRRQEARETDAATASGLSLEAVKVEIVRALNRISEGNAEPVFHHLLRVLQRSSAKLQSQHNSGKHSSEVHAYIVEVRHLICEQLMQSCIKSRFSTNSLIATQTALCCALSKMWDMELCREFLRSLAVCFSTSFAESLSVRTQQPEVVVADTASLVTRHSVVGLCCLYDFGFVSPRLFVELIRRVAGLRDTEASKEGRSSLSDYRVELLLLLLRLGGGKLRQDDANLFTSTWKQLQGLVQVDDGRAVPRLDREASHAADELPAGAGRLRALIMELQDLKAGKQKDRLMLVKASQDAMRRWLSSNSVFGPTLLTSQYQIDGSWDALERGERPELSKAAAAAADFQQHQRLRATNAAAAADATVVGALASSIQQKASLLRALDYSRMLCRFNTELQKALFECLMMANGPDDALRALQNSGLLTLKKNTVTQVVAVTMQCCLQEKIYNGFYGMVLSRLCGICGCGASSANEETTCFCFLLPDKPAARYRRTVQRGLAAQVSAAHGFSLRRLLNLAKLTAFLIRVGITDLRIVRFLSFESSVEGRSPMGLTGKLGVFLREVCIEVLSIPTARSSSPSTEVAAEYFSCLRSMSDICEVFIALLQDVVLPTAAPDGRSVKEKHTAKSSEGGRVLKASIVKAALNALQQPEP